jgi:hypothetical protein
MALLWTFLALVVIYSAALAFRPALRCGPRGRFTAWLIASLVAGLAPALVPVSASVPRLFATFAAIAMLAKLYDLWRKPEPALEISAVSYLLYFMNWFWLVRGKRPPDVPTAHDRRMLIRAAPNVLVMLALTTLVFSLDWWSLPPAVEHTAKAVVLGITVIITVNAIARIWRLSGASALDPMHNPAAARTPADTWRRWNRPAQQFFQEHAYAPMAGHGRLHGIFMAFLVSALVHEYVFGIATARFQGWQFLFFGLHGLATAATSHFRPRGWAKWPAIAATFAFNIALLAIFAKSVSMIVPFYSPR